MKKLFILPFITLFTLTSCNAPATSTSENEIISSPKDDDSSIKDITFLQDKQTLNGQISIKRSDFNNYSFSLFSKDNEKIYDNVSLESNNINISVPQHGKYDLVLQNNTTNSEEKTEILFDVDEVNIAYLRATAPVSMFTYLTMNDNIQTYFDIERGKSYQFDRLPETYHIIPNIRENYKENNFDAFLTEYPYVNDLIEDLVQDIPDIKINYYTVEQDNTSPIVTLYNNLDPDQFNVNVLSDGTVTLLQFSENLYSKSEFENQVKLTYDIFMGDRIKGQYTEIPMAAASRLYFTLAVKESNVNFYVQGKDDYLAKCDEYMKEIYTKELKDLTFVTMHDNLKQNPELLKQYEYIFGTRWGGEL